MLTVEMLQALVSRETAPMDTAVISITRLAAGEGAYNVIPEHATFGGSMRSLSHEHLMLLKRRVTEARAWPLGLRPTLQALGYAMAACLV